MQPKAKPLTREQADPGKTGSTDSVIGIAALALILAGVVGYVLLSGKDKAVLAETGGFPNKEEQSEALAEGFTSPVSWAAKKKLDAATAAHQAELNQQAFSRQAAELQAATARDRMELQLILQPAPAGKPKDVAATVLGSAVAPAACPSVKAAKRKPDGSIVATCSNGEKYLVFNTAADGDTAMKCSAVIKLSTVTC